MSCFSQWRYVIRVDNLRDDIIQIRNRKWTTLSIPNSQRCSPLSQGVVGMVSLGQNRDPLKYLASVQLINVSKVTFMGMCTCTKNTCPGFCVCVVYSLALFSNPKSIQGGPSNTGVMQNWMLPVGPCGKEIETIVIHHHFSSYIKQKQMKNHLILIKIIMVFFFS